MQEAGSIVPGSSTELEVVNTETYSGAIKKGRESVIIIKSRQKEEGKTNEATLREISRIKLTYRN